MQIKAWKYEEIVNLKKPIFYVKMVNFGIKYMKWIKYVNEGYKTQQIIY